MSDTAIVMEADIRGASMRLVLALDGDHYHNQSRCVEFPELTRLDTGPKSRRFKGHTREYFVNGERVEATPEAIASAINEFRATRGNAP